MLSVAEAHRRVIERARALPVVEVRPEDAVGRVLAEDVASDIDLPPFDKALVDGYAVRAAEVNDGRPLIVGEEVLAGRTPTRPLAEGEAAVVMTGAPLPEGADAMVMVEQAREVGDGRVAFDGGPVRPGQNRLTKGRELRAGEVVLRAGTRINAVHVGVLASVGRVRVEVVRRPRVVVIPTGDELVDPGQVPGPGQIRNSNAGMLAALVRSDAATGPTWPITPDDPEALRTILAKALNWADVLLVSGGVSAGKRDLVPEALTNLGVEPVFHKVDVRPGKPLWFGVGKARADRTRPLVFGLPGNPVSGVVSVLLFVRPALDVLNGGRPAGPPIERAMLAEPFAHRGPRPTFHPARAQRSAEGRLWVRPLDWAGSPDLRAVAEADGFAAFPGGDADYPAGAAIEFLRISV
ncbi:MAG TPA: gephyrin-like molybdotransferase Glp [Isosphaeraceae bacterium]|nr:gephyrin-like molybdotransferase Glp [Isosphaeraceae bacterium]